MDGFDWNRIENVIDEVSIDFDAIFEMDQWVETKAYLPTGFGKFL